MVRALDIYFGAVEGPGLKSRSSSFIFPQTAVYYVMSHGHSYHTSHVWKPPKILDHRKLGLTVFLFGTHKKKT